MFAFREYLLKQGAPPAQMCYDYSSAPIDYTLTNTKGVPLFCKYMTVWNRDSNKFSDDGFTGTSVPLANGIIMGVMRNGKKEVWDTGGPITVLRDLFGISSFMGPSYYLNGSGHAVCPFTIILEGLILYPGDQLFWTLNDDLSGYNYLRAMVIAEYANTTAILPQEIPFDSIELAYLDNGSGPDMTVDHSGAISYYEYTNNRNKAVRCNGLTFQAIWTAAPQMLYSNFITGGALTNGISLGVERNGSRTELCNIKTNADLATVGKILRRDYRAGYGAFLVYFYVNGLLLYPNDVLYCGLHDDFSTKYFMRVFVNVAYGK